MPVHLFSVVLLFAFAIPAAAQTPAPGKVDEKTIRALIDDLGHDSFERRELAEKRLAQIGEPALRLLGEAAERSSDFEVRERAEKLMANIQSRLFPFVWSVPAHAMRATRIALTPDGKRYVCTGFASVCLGDVETGKMLLSFGEAPSTRYYRCVAITADGSRAFVGADDKIARLFDLKTGKQLREFSGHEGPIQGVGLLPGGKRAVSGSKDRTLRIWELATGKQLAKLDVGEGIYGMSLSPDGKTVAAGHFPTDPERPGTLRLWDIQNQKLVREFAGHTREVTYVSFSSDGKRLVSSSFDRTVRVWDIATGNEVKQFACGSLMECAYFVDGDRQVICTGKETDLTLQLWDVHKGRRIMRSPAVEQGLRDIAPLTTVKSKAVIAGVDGVIRLWQWSK